MGEPWTYEKKADQLCLAAPGGTMKIWLPAPSWVRPDSQGSSKTLTAYSEGALILGDYEIEQRDGAFKLAINGVYSQIEIPLPVEPGLWLWDMTQAATR